MIDQDTPLRFGLTNDGSAFLKEMEDGIGFQKLKPRLELLASKGFAPHFDFLEKEDSLWAVMTPIKGQEVYDLYVSNPDKLYSVGFAKSLAEAHLGLYESGLWHCDIHCSNILLEEETDKCVIVDLDSVTRRGHMRLSNYITEYVDALLSAYLGENIRILAGDMKFKGRIQEVVEGIGSLEALIEEENVYINNPAFQLQYTEEPMKSILVDQGRIDRVDSRVMDFIFRACDKRTRPRNFNKILNI